MVERVLVAGVGNIFLSDDGFGPAVAAALLAHPLPAAVRVVDYGIRGLHLAFDLHEGVKALILVDTVPEAAGEPGSLVVLEVPGASTHARPSEPAAGSAWGLPGGFDGHAMEPGVVFRTLSAMSTELPRTLVVGCQPAGFEERIGLSPAVAAAVPVAAGMVLALAQELLNERTLQQGGVH